LKVEEGEATSSKQGTEHENSGKRYRNGGRKVLGFNHDDCDSKIKEEHNRQANIGEKARPKVVLIFALIT